MIVPLLIGDEFAGCTVRKYLNDREVWKGSYVVERSERTEVLEVFYGDFDRFDEVQDVAKTLSRLDCCPEVYDCGEFEGRRFIRREFFPGVDLRSWFITREPIMDSKYIPAALKVLYELVCAFDSIQKEGVFHRDVKPYNVVVQDDGRVKVIDFDLATFGWFEEVDDEWTFLWKPSDGVGSTYGTDGYMSPEAIDHRKHYDSSSEAFSLGITMLETLLRKHPFAGMNNFDAVLRIIKGEVPTLSEERFGKELSDLVANTLLVDRELRYDVDALKFYLGKLMKNRGLLE